MTIRVPEEIGQRLAALAKQTGRTKSFYVREAIVRLIDDLEDEYVAMERLENPGCRLSMEEADTELGLNG